VEVHVNQFAKRTTGTILVVALGAFAVAAPSAADPVAKPAAASSLAALSPASLEILRAAPAPRTQEAQGVPSAGFFKSRRGALALGLVAAGVGFTIWSIHDSRKPVKSPVR
jgi:hypothetical protein